MAFSDQLRGARAMLNWTRQDLAERTNLSVNGIKNIEDGGVPNERTKNKILKALGSGGIRLTENGVEKAANTFVILDGEDFFIEVLDDIYLTLLDAKNPELLIEYSDDRKSLPEVIGRYRKIRNAGIKMRQMVEEGNTYLIGPVSEYRWIPKKYFLNYLKLIYADKVLLDMGTSGTLIKNSELAESQRKDFELKWTLLPPVAVESEANVRF